MEVIFITFVFISASVKLLAIFKGNMEKKMEMKKQSSKEKHIKMFIACIVETILPTKRK